MSEVFDLDAVASEAGDAEREPFRFRFGGDEYEMPAEFDLLALAAITAGELGDGLRIMLGETQWSRMLRSGAKMDTARFKALFETYSAHVGGTTMGESSASTGSSVSTEGPSKPISNGSTKSGSAMSSVAAAPGVASPS